MITVKMDAYCYECNSGGEPLMNHYEGGLICPLCATRYTLKPVMVLSKEKTSIDSDTKWIRECHFESKECYEPGHLRMACEMGKEGKVTPGHHCYKDTVVKHKERIK